MLTVRVSITFGMASIIEDLGTRGEASVEIWTVVPGGPNGCSDLEPGSVGRQKVDGCPMDGCRAPQLPRGGCEEVIV